MKISVELNEENIRGILAAYLNNEFSINIQGSDLHIEVKSKKYFDSDWEIADIRIKQEIIPTNR